MSPALALRIRRAASEHRRRFARSTGAMATSTRGPPALKAAGVTFAVSMIERLIEEQVRGDVVVVAHIRDQIVSEIGADLRNLGSSVSAL